MHTLDRALLYGTVFITGAAVLMVEILGSRILAPFYGSTIFVWSSLISVTLGALALGYYGGGIVADRAGRAAVIPLFVGLAGVFITLIPAYDSWVLVVTAGAGLKYGPLLASLLLFTLPLGLLGSVSPLAVKLQADSLQFIGVTVGGLYATATLGSLLGGAGMGFYLAPAFSISVLLMGIGLALVLVSLAWCWVLLHTN